MRLGTVAACLLAACSTDSPTIHRQRSAMGEAQPLADVTRLGSAMPDGRARERLLAAAKDAATSPAIGIATGSGVASAFARPMEIAKVAPTSSGPTLAPETFRHVVRSSEAIEAALRRSVYFDLVTRCTDASGRILQPEAIALSFLIDEGGAIVPSSVRTRVVIAGPGHAEAAACMARALAGSSLDLRLGGDGDVTEVETLVPSVD